MKRPLSRIAVPLAIAAVASVAVCAPMAKSQVMAAPSYQAIGVASTGNSSMVWLHEPSSGRLVACQSVATQASGPSAIQCQVAKLPYPAP